MKPFLLFVITLLLGCFPFLIYSQVSFERTYGYFDLELGTGVVQTYDHGYAFLSTYMGDGSVIVGAASIIKTDSLGNSEWEKSITGSSFTDFTWGRNLKVTRDSGFISIGYAMSFFSGDQ